jgi:L-aminopeptidase/D-esterase-like protein
MAGAVKGGIGSASLELPGGAVVAAVVAVNAYGGVFDHGTGRLVAGPRQPNGDGFDDPVAILLEGVSDEEGPPMSNTTIGVVATDASLTREEANHLATLSHDGLALVIRPCHTMRDGDTMFALATGRHPQPVELTVLGAAAVEVTARAVLRAVGAATGLGGIPSVSELAHG